MTTEQILGIVRGCFNEEISSKVVNSVLGTTSQVTGKDEFFKLLKANLESRMGKCLEAQVYFPGDPSVGVFPWGFQMELPENCFDVDDNFREETREQIRKLYTELDGEFGCQVFFADDENDDDDED